VEEAIKRHRLEVLRPLLERLVGDGAVDARVHDALGMILIAGGSDPEHFLATNPHYDSEVLGKHCEARSWPKLACAAYARGNDDLGLVRVTNITVYMFQNNMTRDIVWLVEERVDPANALWVVGALLEQEGSGECIKTLVLSAPTILLVGPLVEEAIKRHRLEVLRPLLERLVGDGAVDARVHDALGMILIAGGSDPEHFLATNPHYDSEVLGKHCEARSWPKLACAAYARGNDDLGLVRVTNEHSLFKEQSNYAVRRMDQSLWARLLSEHNPHRHQLIQKVSTTALPESGDRDQVSVAIAAFTAAGVHQELVCPQQSGYSYTHPYSAEIVKVFLDKSNGNIKDTLTQIKVCTKHIKYTMQKLSKITGYESTDVKGNAAQLAMVWQ